MSNKKKAMSWETKYEVIDELGTGGNAHVYLVKKLDDNEEYALKYLYNRSSEKKNRFLDEIRVTVDNQETVEGILPIVEYSLDEYWYIMPVATEIIEHIKSTKLSGVKIVQGFIDIATSLKKLHQKGVSHRDLKPSNLYYFNNRFYIGDFGLVDLPDSDFDYTRSDRGLGAIFTIAPEMKRDPKHADGKKADIFSLAKTLWMLLTLDERGYDGTYNHRDLSYGLRFNERTKRLHLVELEKTFALCTDNTPENRPEINDFVEQLNKWIDIATDTTKSQLSEWNFLNGILFGKYSQTSAKWSDREAIVDVLNVVGSLSAYNHMFFPDGGGLDFSVATIGNETDCIYIYADTGYCIVGKPKVLHYEGFSGNFDWNYFILELDDLKPIFGEPEIDFEFLVEDYPSHYVSAQYEQYGVYDYDIGNKLPDGYKTVRRYMKGKFLIVLKSGPYNKISSTYDGRHNDCSVLEFRDYTEQMIRVINGFEEKGKSKEVVLRSGVFRNPFRKEEPDDTFYITSFEEEEKFKKIIKENINHFKFQGIVDENKDENNIKFYIEYNDYNGLSYDFLSNQGCYLCKDGYFRTVNRNNSEDIYYIYNRTEAIKIKDNLIKEIKKEFLMDGLVDVEVNIFFTIELSRIGKPQHLFTKEEMKNIMASADDRVDNVLVIDEYGYVSIVQDWSLSRLYPVHGSTWNAGNQYVGKYSHLYTLDDDYNHSLQGWLEYLQRGDDVRLESFYEILDENELIASIMKYY